MPCIDRSSLELVTLSTIFFHPKRHEIQAEASALYKPIFTSQNWLNLFKVNRDRQHRLSCCRLRSSRMEMLPDCNRLSGIGSPMPLSLPQMEGELKLSKKRCIPVIKFKSGIQGKGLSQNLFPMSLTHFDKQIADALQKLNESKPDVPDVLIADTGMLQIDGYMLIRQVISNPLASE